MKIHHTKTSTQQTQWLRFLCILLSILLIACLLMVLAIILMSGASIA